MSDVTTEKHAIQTRSERLRVLSGDGALRRGDGDRLEVGFGSVPAGLSSSDAVAGLERAVLGGCAETAENLVTQARRVETHVTGTRTLQAKSDTTLLAGTVVDHQAGAILVLAGMSDDMMLGGGVRATAGLDLWLSGVIGMEEKVGTAMADLALVEVGSTTFEREYGVGLHAYLAARFSGALHTTMATGFRALCSVTTAVRNKMNGAGEGGGAATPSQALAYLSGDATALTTVASGAGRPAKTLSKGGRRKSIGRMYKAADVSKQVAQAADAVRDLRVQVGNLEAVEDASRALSDLTAVADGEDAAALRRLRSATGLESAEDNFTARVLASGDLSEAQKFDVAADGGQNAWQVRYMDDDPLSMFGGQMLTADDLARVNGDAGRGLGEADVELPAPPPELDLPPATLGPPLDHEARRLAMGLPGDFDYGREVDAFRQRTLGREFRGDMSPGYNVRRQTLFYVDELSKSQLDNLLEDPWMAARVRELGIDAANVMARDAYAKLAEIETALRAAGDATQADFVRGTMTNVDAQAYRALQQATNVSEDMRNAYLNSTTPANIDSARLRRTLQEQLEKAQEQMAWVTSNPDAATFTEDYAYYRNLTGYYQASIDALDAGRDPSIALREMFLMSDADNAATAPETLRNLFSLDIDDFLPPSGLELAKQKILDVLYGPGARVDFMQPAGYHYARDAVSAPAGADDLRKIPAGWDTGTQLTRLDGVFDVDDIDDDVYELYADASERSRQLAMRSLGSMPEEWIDAASLRSEFDGAIGDGERSYNFLKYLQDFWSRSADAGDADAAAKARYAQGLLDQIDATSYMDFTYVLRRLEESRDGAEQGDVARRVLDLPSDDLDDVIRLEPPEVEARDLDPVPPGTEDGFHYAGADEYQSVRGQLEVDADEIDDDFVQVRFGGLEPGDGEDVFVIRPPPTEPEDADVAGRTAWVPELPQGGRGRDDDPDDFLDSLDEWLEGGRMDPFAGDGMGTFRTGGGNSGGGGRRLVSDADGNAMDFRSWAALRGVDATPPPVPPRAGVPSVTGAGDLSAVNRLAEVTGTVEDLVNPAEDVEDVRYIDFEVMKRLYQPVGESETPPPVPPRGQQLTSYDDGRQAVAQITGSTADVAAPPPEPPVGLEVRGGLAEPPPGQLDEVDPVVGLETEDAWVAAGIEEPTPPPRGFTTDPETTKYWANLPTRDEADLPTTDGGRRVVFADDVEVRELGVMENTKEAFPDDENVFRGKYGKRERRYFGDNWEYSDTFFAKDPMPDRTTRSEDHPDEVMRNAYNQRAKPLRARVRDAKMEEWEDGTKHFQKSWFRSAHQNPSVEFKADKEWRIAYYDYDDVDKGGGVRWWFGAQMEEIAKRTEGADPSGYIFTEHQLFGENYAPRFGGNIYNSYGYDDAGNLVIKRDNSSAKRLLRQEQLMDQRVWDELSGIDSPWPSTVRKLKKGDGRKLKLDKFGNEVGFFAKGTTYHHLPHKKILSRLADGKALGEFDHSEIKTVEKVIGATTGYDPGTVRAARNVVNGQSFKGAFHLDLDQVVIADELVDHALGVASRNASRLKMQDAGFEDQLAQMVYLNPGVDADLFSQLA